MKLKGGWALPAGVLTGIMGALWVWGRWIYAGGWDGMAFVGWLVVMLVVATVLGIMWGARERGDEGRWRGMLGYGLLVDAGGVMIVGIGAGGGWMGFWAAVRVYVVLSAWVGMWVAAAGVMRKWGTGVSVAACTGVAMVLLAGPVTLMPMARVGGGGGGGGAWGGWVGVVTGLGSPVLGMVEAMRPDRMEDWTKWPVMYGLTGWGQDMALEQPRWWVSAGVYGVVGLGLWGLGWVVKCAKRGKGV